MEISEISKSAIKRLAIKKLHISLIKNTVYFFSIIYGILKAHLINFIYVRLVLFPHYLTFAICQNMFELFNCV